MRIEKILSLKMREKQSLCQQQLQVLPFSVRYQMICGMGDDKEVK